MYSWMFVALALLLQLPTFAETHRLRAQNCGRMESGLRFCLAGTSGQVDSGRYLMLEDESGTVSYLSARGLRNTPESGFITFQSFAVRNIRGVPTEVKYELVTRTMVSSNRIEVQGYLLIDEVGGRSLQLLPFPFQGTGPLVPGQPRN